MDMLNVGDLAPHFEAKIQDGTVIKLSDFKGKKVVLFFYPKDNTPGCTAQNCSLNEKVTVFNDRNIELIGVSPDSEVSHLKFIGKYNLKQNLIADTEKELAKLYNVWGIKKMYGKEYEGIFRTTFIIDEQGIIQDIIQKVDTKNHAEQVLSKL
ncbi:MAG: thioredoxin-dependent thiol peroxidase [Bacteroidales bacterium]|nr:thioredoxin-dependent thiol peroxidase [Bacteroidales bacterium]